MKEKISIIFFVIFIYNSTFGQINESDSLRFKFNGNLLFNYQEGNVNLFRITSQPTLLVALDKENNFVYKSQNRLTYQEFSKNKTDLDAENHSFLYYQPSKKWYPFAYTYLGTNFRRQIDLRFYTGAGVTYQLLNKSKYIFKIAGSISYDFTKFENKNFNKREFNTQKEFQTIRPVFYANGKYIINSQTKFQFMYYFQPDIQDITLQRHHADIWLDFELNKNISFITHYLYNFESLVVNGVKNRDQILSVGINYQFNKK